MSTLEDKSIWEDGEESLGEEVLRMSTDEIVSRTRLLDNEIKIMKSEVMRINHELQAQTEKIKENTEKIKVNKTLPYLVSNVIELLDVDPQEEEEDGAVVDLDAQRKGKCAVVKTSTRQTYFLPVIGLVDEEKLKPGDLVGVNKDSYLILETLPAEYDARVKAMEVDERPTEQYSDIGGLDKQIQELIEAVVLPMTHKEKFLNLGIHPPKGKFYEHFSFEKVNSNSIIVILTIKPICFIFVVNTTKIIETIYLANNHLRRKCARLSVHPDMRNNLQL